MSLHVQDLSVLCCDDLGHVFELAHLLINSLWVSMSINVVNEVVQIGDFGLVNSELLVNRDHSTLIPFNVLVDL